MKDFKVTLLTWTFFYSFYMFLCGTVSHYCYSSCSASHLLLLYIVVKHARHMMIMIKCELFCVLIVFLTSIFGFLLTHVGTCFPSLRHIGLADCPIESIPEDAHQNFENLQSLSMTNTQLHSLSDLSHINAFPSLTELRIQGVPLLSEMTGELICYYRNGIM